MPDFLGEKLKFIRQECRSVLNVGAGRNDRLKSFFNGHQYQTLDSDAKSGADFIADAHHIPLADNSVDGLVSFSLIEHTHSPAVVVDEMYRVLKPGGYALLSTPFIHPYHGGNCPDYYRFTKDGLAYLFRNFSQVEIDSDGGFFIALKFFLPHALEPLRFITNPVCNALDAMFMKHRSSRHEYFVFARK